MDKVDKYAFRISTFRRISQDPAKNDDNFSRHKCARYCIKCSCPSSTRRIVAGIVRFRRNGCRRLTFEGFAAEEPDVANRRTVPTGAFPARPIRTTISRSRIARAKRLGRPPSPTTPKALRIAARRPLTRQQAGQAEHQATEGAPAGLIAAPPGSFALRSQGASSGGGCACLLASPDLHYLGLRARPRRRQEWDERQ